MIDQKHKSLNLNMFRQMLENSVHFVRWGRMLIFQQYRAKHNDAPLAALLKPKHSKLSHLQAGEKACPSLKMKNASQAAIIPKYADHTAGILYTYIH